MKLHRLLLVILNIGLVTGISAQENITAAFHIGGAGSEELAQIHFDPTTNHAIAVGTLQGSLIMGYDPDFTWSSASGFTDGYILKMDDAGAVLWLGQIGGGNIDIMQGSDVDYLGNIYASGVLWGPGDIDPSDGEDVVNTNGFTDGYLVKMSPDGEYEWGFVVGGTLTDNFTDIHIDEDRLLVCGTINGTADFDPLGGGWEETSDDNDGFVAEYNLDGELQWVKILDSTSQMSVKQVVTTSTGAVVISGEYMATLDADPGAGEFLLESTGEFDTFVLQLDENQELVYAFTAGAPGTESVRGLAIDDQDAVVYGGHKNGDMIYADGVDEIVLETAGQSDGYMIKLDMYGDPEWGIVIGSNSADSVEDVVFDSDGNVSCTGHVNADAAFDPAMPDDVSTLIGNVGDAYLATYSSAGEFEWVVKYGNPGVESANTGYALANDIYGNLWLGGSFYETIQAHPGDVNSELTSLGSSDTFIYKTGDGIVGLDHQDLAELLLFPNPATDHVTIQSLETGIVEIRDSLGKIVYAQASGFNQLDISHLPSGMYHVSLTNGQQQVMSRLVID